MSKIHSIRSLARVAIVGYFVILMCQVFAQQAGDSTYLPRIRITSSNGYGPYFINTKRTNVFIVDSLPVNTSKVVMRFIDSKGGQLGTAYTKEGTNIADAVWVVESEDVGFVLSPHLSVEVTYQADSTAEYRIPYLVYPDTVKFSASAGWGPMVTNDYPFSDTSWSPVPPLYNDFRIYNLPPRTDSLLFQVIAADSSVLLSHAVYASGGEYLDSASFLHVRMDSMPLATRYLQTLLWCEGGPDSGLVFHHDLVILPQEPRLISVVDGTTLADSIPPFEEHQLTGQVLQLDSTKYAEIMNGPGRRNLGRNLEVIYSGPYSLDILSREYMIEAWLQFDYTHMFSELSDFSIMSVDTVWEFRLDAYSDQVWFTMRSLIDSNNTELFTAYVPRTVMEQSEWHHVAIGMEITNGPQMHFFLDGEEWHDTEFFQDNYQNIILYTNYESYLKTQPLFLGVNPALYSGPMKSLVTGMDEVRIWGGYVYPEEIKANYHEKVLQSEGLFGYWNFDDLRNRLGLISDLSFNNNTGQLKNGAYFSPQEPSIHTSYDTLCFYSGNALADKVIWEFVDLNQETVFSDTALMNNGSDTLVLDVSDLPYTVKTLRLRYSCPGSPDTGFVRTYPLLCKAPQPVATPRFNWNTYYNSPDNLGTFRNSVMLSGLPDHTMKVALGLQKDDTSFNVDTLTQNSIPYRYSLRLNGTDNYVSTSQAVIAPARLDLSLWFRTSSRDGARIIGLVESTKGPASVAQPTELILEKDGALRFYVESESGSVYLLEGAHAYNDGTWHNVRVRYTELYSLEMYVDSSLVDLAFLDDYINAYTGNWIIGLTGSNRLGEEDALAAFFNGSICELRIEGSDLTEPVQEIRSNYSFYYPFDDGKGQVVLDKSGNNDGEIQGSNTSWFTANTLSFVEWYHNIIDKDPGTYTFFAVVNYNSGPAEGVRYDLGRLIIIAPFPRYNFAYDMGIGFGYFNEGTALTNSLIFYINNTDSDSADWKENFLKYQFFTLDHSLIDQGIYTYTDEYNADSRAFDIGDAPPGSYLSLEVGYHTTNEAEYVTGQLSLPIYIHQMIPPIVSADFGPFDQAIAPGTMVQENTFAIITEILSDLNTVKARFKDVSGKQIASKEATQIDDTTWHVTYNMGALSPPVTNLTLEYYLGEDSEPALVQGPFPITIHKTRPRFFDFVADSSFHNIVEKGDSVTFDIVTPNEKNKIASDIIEVTAPLWIPLVGGTESRMETPKTIANLKFKKSTYKLSLDQSPTILQDVYALASGSASKIRFDFNTSQTNTYGLDKQNDLLATQNFAIGGTMTSTLTEIEFLVKKIQKLLSMTGVVDPESVIVKPNFQIRMKGGFEYSQRLNLMVDTVDGGWGSHGSLDIDANPDHTQAYKKSASYNFYSISMGMEFDLGAEFLEGLLSGYFGLDGRIVTGFGRSYFTIPYSDSKQLKSGAFQLYGRFFIEVAWGWYEKNIWGPKMFYSSNFWGDNMNNCFPPPVKSEDDSLKIASNTSWPGLTEYAVPVRNISRMPLPVPQPHVLSQGDKHLFTWIERGKSYGERGLYIRYLDETTKLFSEKRTVELNNNALNSPIVDAVDKNLSFFCWAQNRYDNQSFLAIRPEDAMTELVKGQDIWVAVYDLEKDSIIYKSMIEDNMDRLNSGRAEANPAIAVINDTRVMVIWQAADLDNHESELWYTLLEKSGEGWEAGTPRRLGIVDGVATQLQIASTGSGNAVATWLSSSRTDAARNSIQMCSWDGTEWSGIATALDHPGEFYNYFTMAFNKGIGGMVVSAYTEDSLSHPGERLTLIPWEEDGNLFSSENPVVLLTDTIHHLQLPQLAVADDGTATIALKLEEMVGKEMNRKVCQVDVLTGTLLEPHMPWHHIEANPFICDTLKQVADLQIGYVGTDTLMVLMNEFPLMATNVNFTPSNGVFFGDPYMNLIFRSFSLGEDGEVVDVPEGSFFTGIPEYRALIPQPKIYQNYPNPCNERTTIIFDVPESGRVRLDLFDINGSMMATLFENRVTPGRYELDVNTSLLRPGTYIYRLTTDESSTSLRMIVAR